MFSQFERMLAWRYLRSKKSEGFVSVIAGFSFVGILLGVATLIIVMSVMNGFRQELFSRILGIGGHMNVYAMQTDGLMDYEAMRIRIEPIEGVQDAVPIIENQALLSSAGKASGVMVRGIAWEDFMNRPLLRDSIIQGSLDDFNDDGIAMGRVLARRIGVGLGDQITLTSPQVKATPFGSMPRQARYTVAQIFDVGMHEYNANFIFMPLSSAQTFFGMKGNVSAIEVFLSDPEKLDEIKNAVMLLVDGQAGVFDWRDLNASFFNALQVERNVMFVILTLIILVAAFNIISSMIMLVKDKGQDIAILRTIGASQTNMLKIFILTGASIGFIGTFFGALAGILFAANIDAIKEFIENSSMQICRTISGAQAECSVELFSEEIYFLSRLPAEINWNEVTSVIFMALILSIGATIYPAWRAARLDPVQGLRYE